MKRRDVAIFIAGAVCGALLLQLRLGIYEVRVDSYGQSGIQYFVVNKYTGRVWAKPVELVQPERRP